MSRSDQVVGDTALHRMSYAERALRFVAGDGGRAALLCVALAAVQLVGSNFAERGQPDRKPLDAVAVLLILAGPAALFWQRRFPLASLWTVFGVTLTYLLLEYPFGPVLLSPIVALYLSVTSGHRGAAWLAAGTLYFGHFALRMLFDLEEEPTWTQALGVAAWLLVVLAASELMRVRRDQTREAERSQQEEVRRRASEERLHIARELHDVLAHHISLINVQAGVGLHLMDRKPEQARIALTAIEQASREAMSELRSVLHILGHPDEPAPRAPAPSLDRLESLISQAAAAGLEVHAEVVGEPEPLPGPVEAAAFRIVQEALTNVVRHARATHATVRVRYGEDDLTVQVEDDGRGPVMKSSAGGGNGIPGMRERVLALGGELEARALPGRGFRVHARLPREAVS